jgi:hypothetical protein
MENPYQPPIDTPLLDVDPTRRPRGVSILAVLTGVVGLLLLALYIFLLSNWRENNERMSQDGMPPALFWTMTGLTVILSLALSVGIWRGAKWSWWIMCGVLVLYVISNVGQLVIVMISGGVFVLDLISTARAIRSLILAVVFALLLRYWLGRRVRLFFQFASAGGLKAILLSGLTGIGLIFLITGAIFLAQMSRR